MHAVRSTIRLALAALAGTCFLFGCSEDETKEEPPAEKLKVAFVYITTPGDVGWTYAHDVGRKEAASALQDVELTYAENVAEDEALAEAKFEELVAAGNKLIFTTSFGYMDPTVAVAAKHPEVRFEHCSGYKSAENVSNYFGRIYQARYLSGIVAGRMTTNGSIGYVAAFPIPEVVRGINAFTLGVRSVNPTATVQVQFTSTWYDPGLEGQAAQVLIDAGVDVITQHQDSTATIERAKDAGIYAIGYNSDLVPVAPDTVLTNPVWRWGTYYTERIKALQEGTWKSHSYWGSIADGIVDLGPYGNKVPQAVKDEVTAKRELLVSGNWDVFHGPFNKQDGTPWAAENRKLEDSVLLSMDAFVEGVAGSISQD